MAGPAEILIVLGVFGLVGLYLYMASRFIRADEHASTKPKPKPNATNPTNLDKTVRRALC